MKKILTACGYNHAWAFKETDNEKITELEAFVQTRHRKIADSFEEYKEIDPFEFLPGHRALIFGIKAQLLSMEESKKPKVKPRVKNPIKNVPTENELKTNLTNQLSNFSSNLAMEIDWSNSIQSFDMETKEDDTIVKCALLCPICNALRTLRYDAKYWKLSNMTKHIRSHIDANENADRTANEPKKTTSVHSTIAMEDITNKEIKKQNGLKQKVRERDSVPRNNSISFEVPDDQDFIQNVIESRVEYTGEYDADDLIHCDDSYYELDDTFE